MNVCVDILGPEKSVKQFLKVKLTFLKDGYKQAKDNKPRTRVYSSSAHIMTILMT